MLRTLEKQLSSSRGSPYIPQDSVYNSPQDILLHQCILGLSVKRDSFDELSSRAQNLIETVMLHPILHSECLGAITDEIQSTESILANKDHQETAIFIFTIVTVIFLPLSTVSSYLGMNTSDIRDMQTKQWVFWAVAIPLTVVVLILARLWAGPALPQLYSSSPAYRSSSPQAIKTVPRMENDYSARDRETVIAWAD